MEMRKRVLGLEHPDTLTIMANFASTYRNQGRSKEANELEVQVMKTRKRLLGLEHPSTLTSMLTLHRHIGSKAGGRKPSSWRCKSWRRERGCWGLNILPR